MDRDDLLRFMRAQSWAVEASVSDAGAPQAAVIGVAVTDDAELLFDTTGDTRKAQNLRKNPRIALVLGWDDGQTVQYEGVVDEPTGEALVALKRVYLARFPDGVEREKWPNIVYFRARPIWIRYSDFRGAEPSIATFDGDALLATAR